MSLLAQPSLPPPLPGQRSSRRRSLRRAVRVECQVLSDLWDGQAPFLATDLSPEGLWLQTPLPLERGEELLVTLSPPRWSSAEPLVALGQVARVGMYRRRNEPRVAGMGVSFVDVDPSQREALQACLRGLPPPLPTPQRQARVLADARLEHLAPEADEELWLALDDGERFVLRAEGALLTAVRPTRALVSVPLAFERPAPGGSSPAPAPARSRRRHRRGPQMVRARVTLRRARLSLVPDLAS